MATIKIKFRPSSTPSREGYIFFQVIHGRIARQINTGYKLFFSEWEKLSSELVPFSPDENRRQYLSFIKMKINEGHRKLTKIITTLNERGKPYTSKDIVEAYMFPAKANTFFCFAENVIEKLKLLKKIRISETYTSALNSFKEFLAEKDILLNEIDSDLMLAYEAFLKEKGICPNTSSFYLRNLRAIYNRAVEKGLTTQQYPFKHVYTGIDKTIKRALTLKDIKRLREMDLNSSPPLAYARDLFMFSFYTRGMSFVDMAYLKKTGLNKDILSYRRRKTNKQLLIHWEECMQEIVNRYPIGKSPYLLPIIKNPEKDERRQYINIAHLVNRNLKQIGEKLGFPIPLTMYVARHSWASIAKSQNIPISIISDSMGHDSETTTRIYLASLDTKIIDKANKLILNLL